MNRRSFLASLAALPAALVALPAATKDALCVQTLSGPIAGYHSDMLAVDDVGDTDQALYTSYCTFNVKCIEGLGIWGSRGQ